MGVKFTDANKWDDVWFSQLTMEQKVMFIYLCDMCDIAGFYEINDRLITLRTNVEDVRGTIESLSKSIIYKGDYIWVKKYMKHQRNLPINVRNGAHKSMLRAIKMNIDKFPEIYDHIPVSDGDIIRQYIEGGGGASPREGRAPSSNSNSNTVTADTPQDESLIARLYKYFVGEENLMGAGITTGTRKILAEAIHIMDVEEWRVYCEARLIDEFKAAPNKFFLEDGWRRYQDTAKAKNKEKKQANTRRKEAKERKSLPNEEAPKDFKEFVKNFGKRTRKTETASNPAS